MENLNLGMFKSYDIRTKHQNLTPETIDRLTESVARYYRDDVKVDSLVIARDARLYCPEVMESLISKVTEMGMTAIINPLQISTCHFYYMCMMNPSAGGVMITASHNPGEYVGMKFVSQKAAPIATGYGPNGGIAKIKEYYILNSREPRGKRGRIEIQNRQEEYIDYSLRLAGIAPLSLKGLRVFGEFLSGAAGMDFMLAFQKAGAEVTPSHLIPNGFFPSGDPNPIIEASIAPAREMMKSGSYDIGFCFDGDGDRMDLMFPDGQQIIPGLNMSLIIPSIQKIFKDYRKDLKCYVDVKAIPLALIEIAKTGIDQHIIRNGHSFIKAKLNEHIDEGFMVCEEESAHYYMNFPFDVEDLSKGFAATENTLFFALVSAKTVKENPEGYSRIKELQKYIRRYREWPLNFDRAEKMECIMQDVEDEMKRRGAVIIKDMDDGSDLDATCMRFNLPVHFTKDTAFPQRWVQVSQRISRSEDAMCRWEVVASDQELCEEYNNIVKKIADSYVEKGYAHY